MELYLVRHGETTWNKEGRYYGHKDVPLSETGVEQAQKLGVYFKNIKFDKVYCSPLSRAVDTAQELTNLPLITDDRLMEQNFGLFEGLTYREIYDRYPDELAMWNDNHESYCIPEGESFLDVRNRAASFIEDLHKEEGKILVVAHKGTFGHMLAELMNLAPSGYWNFVFEQGTYSKIDLEDGFAILRMINRIPSKE